MATNSRETPPSEHGVVPAEDSQAAAASANSRGTSDQRRTQLDRIAAGLGPPLDASSGNEHPGSPAKDTPQPPRSEPADTRSQAAQDDDAVKRYS